MNSGSLLSLNVSARCGLSRNSRQIRPIVERDNPVSAAIEARDQCVACFGVRSSVATITASICSSPIVRGAPGRGSSSRPSRRLSTNRRRHLLTVAGTIPSLAATCVLSSPCEQASTIFDRNASDCADFARRDQPSNCSRSSPVNTNSALGRPVLATHQLYNLHHEFQAQDTSWGRPRRG
jgi:hypothetical protein